MRYLGPALFALTALASPAAAQSPTPSAMDSLLGRLVGRWDMTGTVRGRPATYNLEARRVLARQFVELHMIDAAQPPAYEARVFLGVDSAGHRYIVHWLDWFGAGYSIPHAVGEGRGDTIRFTFAYTDGPFRDTFVYDRPRDSWYFRLESADSTGGWTLFAEYQVRRRSGAPLPNPPLYPTSGAESVVGIQSYLERRSRPSGMALEAATSRNTP